MIKKCNKCKVELSSKNLQRKTDNQCKQCIKGNLFCTYNYEDPVLENLSIVKYRALNSLISYRRNHQKSFKRKGVCFKCGVTLCDKNYYKTKGQVNNRQCKHCKNNQKSCRVSYSEEISKEITLINIRESARKRCLSLTDITIKSYLRHVGYNYHEVTLKMIEIKRKQLVIKRNLKNQGIWVR